MSLAKMTGRFPCRTGRTATPCGPLGTALECDREPDGRDAGRIRGVLFGRGYAGRLPAADGWRVEQLADGRQLWEADDLSARLSPERFRVPSRTHGDEPEPPTILPAAREQLDPILALLERYQAVLVGTTTLPSAT
jgi:hypothetical protein